MSPAVAPRSRGPRQPTCSDPPAAGRRTPRGYARLRPLVIALAILGAFGAQPAIAGWLCSNRGWEAHTTERNMQGLTRFECKGSLSPFPGLCGDWSHTAPETWVDIVGGLSRTCDDHSSSFDGPLGGEWNGCTLFHPDPAVPSRFFQESRGPQRVESVDQSWDRWPAKWPRRALFPVRDVSFLAGVDGMRDPFATVYDLDGCLIKQAIGTVHWGNFPVTSHLFAGDPTSPEPGFALFFLAGDSGVRCSTPENSCQNVVCADVHVNSNYRCFWVEPDCGNLVCEGDEDCETCPADCGQCAPCSGDGICDASEGCEVCPAECPCLPGTVCVANQCVPETSCGNGVCDGSPEDCGTCPADCPCPGGTVCLDHQCVPEPSCGNGVCDGFPEDCSTCPGDCPCPGGTVCEDRQCVPEPSCGNGVCDGFPEDCGTCPGDCPCPGGTVCEDRQCVSAASRTGAIKPVPPPGAELGAQVSPPAPAVDPAALVPWSRIERLLGRRLDETERDALFEILFDLGYEIAITRHRTRIGGLSADQFRRIQEAKRRDFEQRLQTRLRCSREQLRLILATLRLLPAERSTTRPPERGPGGRRRP